MSFILVNNFNTTLSAASSSTATTFTVSSSANLPTLASGEILPITLNDAATRLVFEICYVTGISGNILTVERAQEGTSAQNWNVGDFIWNGPTAGTALLQNTVDPFTSSGLITANGGIVVPSGQTITIPNATANNEPIAFIQSMAGAVLNQVTSSRVLGTTYTNTGARPMCVFVAGSSTGTGQNVVTGTVDNESAFYYATIAGAGFLGTFMFVPPGSTYSAAFTTGSGTLSSWIEFN